MQWPWVVSELNSGLRSLGSSPVWSLCFVLRQGTLLSLIKLIFSTHANVDEWIVREVWQTACSIWLTYYSGGVASHWNWDRLWQHEPLGSWTKLDSLVVNKFLLGREEPSKTSLASNVWLCNSLGSWAQSLSEGHEHESRWSLNLSRLVFCNGWNCIHLEELQKA